MAAYYVLGILLVVWALGLSFVGLTRADFPPTGTAGRAIVGATVLIVVGTLLALLIVTDKEHPKEEAAAKAAEEKQASEGAPEAPASGAPPKGGKTVKVSEKEFSIALAGGNDLKAGRYTFQVANDGKIQHDLAVEGNGLKETRTPLIGAGQNKDLAVDLKPGKYTFYCTVPGHEQSGMKVEVTVAGGKEKPAEKAPAAPPKAPAAKTVKVSEKEFSIALAGGDELKAGKYAFAVANDGKIQHDLAIEGDGLKETKTPLIGGGQSKKLDAELKPGKYKFYCTVPGHEQAGMRVEVTVR